MIEKKGDEGTPEAYLVTFSETTDKLVQIGGVLAWLTVVQSAKGSVSTLKDLSKLEEELGELADAKYGKAMEAMTVASIGVVLVTDGVEAWTAYREGDAIKCTLYTTKAGLGVLKEVSTIEKVAARSEAMECLGSAKGQAALTIAIGAIEIGLNLYESTQTSDEIVKLRCYEGAAAAGVDTGISLIPVYGQIIEGAWTGAMTVFSGFLTEQWKKDVCESPGSAITFLFEYFATDEIPSGIAEDAYEECANLACDLVNGSISNGFPSVFIQPED